MSRIGRQARVLQVHPSWTDAALVAVLLAATLTISVLSGGQHSGTLSPAVILADLTAYTGVLCRRRWPVAALVTTVTAATASMTLSGDHGPVVIAPLLALYQLALTTGHRRRLLLTTGLAALVLAGVPEFAAHVSASGSPWLDAAKLLIVAACGLAVAAGDATRNRRAYVAEVEERARRAEHEREEEARRRVTEERLRIARDLHDSMGHHIALINAQAGMATYVFNEQPAVAMQALGHIKQASRAALEDLRVTVGLLRQPEEPPAPTEPPTGVPGIADLVTSFRESGMRIDYEVDGAVRPLPPAADLTAYRVVQEALTNVRKHAADATARVRLSFQPAALRIVVDNDGNGPPDRAHDGTGHGIIGMRERVTAIGGSLEAGPGPDGGFRVSAALPLPMGGRP